MNGYTRVSDVSFSVEFICSLHRHRVRSVGYVVTEASSEGTLNVALATQLLEPHRYRMLLPPFLLLFFHEPRFLATFSPSLLYGGIYVSYWVGFVWLQLILYKTFSLRLVGILYANLFLFGRFVYVYSFEKILKTALFSNIQKTGVGQVRALFRAVEERPGRLPRACT